MSIMPMPRLDKHCFVPCPPERCDCRRGAPLPQPDPYLKSRMCATCAAALQRGESVVCGCYIPERDSPIA